MCLERGMFGGSTVRDKLADVGRALGFVINYMVISLFEIVLDKQNE